MAELIHLHDQPKEFKKFLSQFGQPVSEKLFLCTHLVIGMRLDEPRKELNVREIQTLIAEHVTKFKEDLENRRLHPSKTWNVLWEKECKSFFLCNFLLKTDYHEHHHNSKENYKEWYLLCQVDRKLTTTYPSSHIIPKPQKNSTILQRDLEQIWLVWEW